MTKSRRNHYVPEWYQKRFLSSDKSAFHYLNLFSPVITLPNGCKKPLDPINFPFSPKQCFCQEDLYTTHFMGFINDEIERYLFGRIDDVGVKAVKAMAEQDLNNLHGRFNDFFEYMDAQKIRTPKGLAWLKSKYPNLSHNQLLYEMQSIRQMHCTTWVESVQEIVLAKNSNIKFIVSDNPVTIYNPACLPDSHEYLYPNEPRIEMKATQTIFPLDSGRCLILTNLDYARNPNLSDPKAFRPNANPYRSTLARMDNTICKRELKDNEVAMINFIIKARARQFIAAERKEWLSPEKIVQGSWVDMGKVLLPPPGELYRYGGEVFGQYQDGRHFYRDAYGRTKAEATYLKKEPIKGKVGVNDPCICGSGKKYKKCCRDKPEENRPSSVQRGIRERNLKFFDIVSNILGLDGKRDWTEVRKNLTDKKIADIHKAVALLWPLETDLMSLLPKPDPKISRALYSGWLDPRIAYQDVTSFSLYADEILILNPFPNPNIIRKEYNPIDNPAQYRQETLKNCLFLISFIPLIEAGVVNMIPDPTHFNRALREEIIAEASKRQKEVMIDESGLKKMTKLAKEDVRRFLFNGPEERIKALVRKTSPEITEEEMQKFLHYVKRKNEEDPMSVLHSPPIGKREGQLFIANLSPNMELGMFVAQATGSFILTSHPYRWKEIYSSIDYYYGGFQTPWEPVAKHMTDFEINVAHFLDPADLLWAQKNGDLNHMKSALRNIWNAVQTEKPNLSQISNLIEAIDKSNEKMNQAINKIMNKKNEGCKDFLKVVQTKVTLSAKIGPAGHSTSSVYRMLLAHAGHEKYLKALPLSLYMEREEESDKESYEGNECE
jgi:hypothetical protein